MSYEIVEFNEKFADSAVGIWNQVVGQGNAFPKEEPMTIPQGIEFFKSQSFTAVALDNESNEVLGLYILHPNNVGRCGHISNASYAVDISKRGAGIGEALVRHCMKKAKQLGFKILQFNAVVKSNTHAIKLYEKLGFIKLGTIKGGFRLKDGKFEDIIPFYINL